MNKSFAIILGAAVLALAAAIPAGGQAIVGPEVYVPAKELPSFVDPNIKSILMDRAEFAKLLAQAQKNVAAAPEIEMAQISQADYTVTVEGRDVAIAGTMTVRSMTDQMVPVPLGFATIGLSLMELDGKAAPLGLSKEGKMVLIVTGKGDHSLKIAGSTQLTDLQGGGVQFGMVVPPSAAGKLTLLAPGDLEVHSNLPVALPEYDRASDRTKAVMTIGGQANIVAVLMGNGHKDDERAILLNQVATTVRVGRAGQTLSSLCDVQILRRGVREMRFTLPALWTITEVDCPSLVKWSVVKAADKDTQELVVRLRTASQGLQALRIIASAGRSGEKWQGPRINLVDANYQRGFLLVETEEDSSLKIRHEELTDARREDANAASAAQGMTPSPNGRLYYHWGEGWSVALELAALEARSSSREMQSVSISRDGVWLTGSYEITAIGRELFDISFDLSGAQSGWDVEQVLVDGKSSADSAAQENKGPFEYRVTPEANGRKLRIELARAVRAESKVNVVIVLRRATTGWDWSNRQQPKVLDVGLIKYATDSVKGVVSVAADSDLDISATQVPPTLAPAGVGRMASLGLGAQTQLAYTYDTAEGRQMRLTIVSKQPKITADSVGLITAQPDGIKGDWRVTYNISRAAAKELYLLVDSSLGQQVKIEPVGHVLASRKVLGAQEAAARKAPAGYDVWQLVLDAPASGAVPLVVHYDRSLPAEPFNAPLIRPQADNVQEAVAIQADEELAIAVEATAANEIDAVDLPPLPIAPKRLVAAYRLEASQRSDVTTAPAAEARLRIKTTVHATYEIPAALALSGDLTTYLGSDGSQRTIARYRLANAGLQFLTFRLHKGASLWSMRVGDQQAKPISDPQDRSAEKYLVSIPRSSGPLEVKIIYGLSGQPGSAVDVAGVDLVGVKINELHWQVIAPPGERIVGQSTRMQATGMAEATPAVEEILSALTPRALILAKTSPSMSPRPDMITVHGGEAMHESTVNNETDAVHKEQEFKSLDKDAARRPTTQPAVAGKAGREELGVAVAGGFAKFGVQKVEGRFTLPIELEIPPASSDRVTFSSLGRSDLSVRLKSLSTFRAWWWVGFSLVLLAGLKMVKSQSKRKFLLMAGVLAVSTLLAVWWPSTLHFANGAFYGAMAMIGIYLLMALGIAMFKRGRRNVPGKTAVASTLLIALIGLSAFAGNGSGAGPAVAADEAANKPVAQNSVLPATMPSEARPAVVIPYSGDPTEIGKADKVLIPYKTFVELNNLADPQRKMAVPDGLAKTNIAVSAVRYDVTVTAASAELANVVVKLDADLEVLGQGLLSLPVPMEGLAVTEASLNGKAAAVQLSSRGLVLDLKEISVTRKGHLQMSAATTAELRGQAGSVNFTLPPLPGGVMKVHLPGQDLVLEAPGIEGVLTSAKTAAGVDWTVPLTANRDVALRWAPRSSGGQADRTLSAVAAHDVHVFHWGMVGVSRLVYSFSGGENDRFELLMPAKAKLTELTGANFKDYVIPANDESVPGYQRIQVRLHRPAKKSYELTVRWVADLPKSDTDAVLMLPQASGVSRESGTVQLRAAGGMNLTIVSAQGGRRTDVADSKATESADQTQAVAQYYWPYRPFALTMRFSRLESQVDAKLDQLVRIAPDNVQLLVHAKLSVQQGRAFGASFQLPEGYELLSAVGEAVGDWYVQTTDKGKQLHVSFRGGVTSTTLVLVMIQEKVRLAHLGVPHVTMIASGAQRLREQSGRLAIQVAASLLAQTEEVSDVLKAIPPASTRDWLGAPQAQAVQFAYTYEKPAFGVVLSLSPQPTRINTLILGGVSLRPTAAEYSYCLRYTISGSPVEGVSFTLPSEYAPLVTVSSPAQRSISHADAGNKQTRWTISFINEVTQTVDVLVNFTLPIDASTTSLPVPRPQTVGNEGYRAVLAVQNFSGHELGVARSEKLGALPVDQQKELLSEQVRSSLQYVFQSFTDDWALDLGVKFAKPATRIQAVVDLMALTTAIDREGNCRYEAKLTLQNRSEQFLRVRFDKDLKLWSATVAGQSVKPVTNKDGKAGEVMIPLVKISPGGLPYEVTLYFAGQSKGTLDTISKIEPPSIAIESMHVIRTTWSLRLPDGYQYMGAGGNMSAVAGTAEIMSITLEARLGQLKRFKESFWSDAVGGRGGEVGRKNWDSFNYKISEDIKKNEQYVEDNKDSLQKQEYSRLKTKLEEQKGTQRELQATWSEAETRQRVQQGNSVNKFVGDNSYNGGLVEGVRNSTLAALPAFVQEAQTRQQEQLRKDIDRAQKENSELAKAGVGNLELKSDDQQLINTDARQAQAKEVLAKVQADQQLQVAAKQQQLQQKLSDLNENRMTRFYGGGQQAIVNGSAVQSSHEIGSGVRPPAGASAPVPGIVFDGQKKYTFSGSTTVVGGTAIMPGAQPSGSLDEVSKPKEGGGGFGNRLGGGGGLGGGGKDGSGVVGGPDGGWVAGGNYSLPVELPQGQVVLDFARPAGDCQLSIWAISRSFLVSVYTTIGIMCIILGAWALGRVWRRLRRRSQKA